MVPPTSQDSPAPDVSSRSDGVTRSPSAPATAARQLLPRLLLSLALGGLFAWLVVRGGVPLIPSSQAFEHVAWWTVGAYTVSLLVVHFFRASRWRFLIRPVTDQIPFWDGVWLNWIGFFAIFALPLRLGEMARPALTKIRHGVSVSAGLGTVAVERVVDGLITSLCVLYALFGLSRLAPQDELALSLPYYGLVAVTVFLSAFVGLLLFLWQRALAVRLVELTFGLLSKRLGQLVAEKVSDVAQGVRSIAQPRLASGFLLETLIYWGTNAGGMWLLGWGCGIDMTPGHGVGIMGILAIGILLPAGPGLFGNFQLAISTALKLYFAAAIVGEQGAVYVFLMYATQAVMITVAGIVPLYALRFRFSDLLHAPARGPEGGGSTA